MPAHDFLCVMGAKQLNMKGHSAMLAGSLHRIGHCEGAVLPQVLTDVRLHLEYCTASFQA